jgi:hypothetical protein
MHVPAWHVSLPVQTLPSSHAAPVFGVWKHPVMESHPSSVHGLKSSQLTAHDPQLIVVISSDQLFSVPVSTARSSVIVSVHVPFAPRR